MTILPTGELFHPSERYFSPNINTTAKVELDMIQIKRSKVFQRIWFKITTDEISWKKVWIHSLFYYNYKNMIKMKVL